MIEVAPYRMPHPGVPPSPNRGKSAAGPHPLRASITTTGRAAFQPRVRKVFVAPRFPLPSFLRSTR